jgi:hypothetical protein
MPILLASKRSRLGGRHGDDLSNVDVILGLLMLLIVSGAALCRGLAGTSLPNWQWSGSAGPTSATAGKLQRAGVKRSELSALAKARHAAKAS